MPAQVQETSPLGPLSPHGVPADPVVSRSPRVALAIVLFTLAALLAAAVQFLNDSALWSIYSTTPPADFNGAQIGGEFLGPLQTFVSSGPGLFAGFPAIAIVVALLAIGIVVLPTSTVRKIVGVILVLIGYPLAFLIQYELIWMAGLHEGTLVDGLVPAIAVLAVSVAWLLARNRSPLAWISLVVVAGVPFWWVMLCGLGGQYLARVWFLEAQNQPLLSPDALTFGSIAAALTLLAFCLPVVVIAWIAALLDRRRPTGVRTPSAAAPS